LPPGRMGRTVMTIGMISMLGENQYL